MSGLGKAIEAAVRGLGPAQRTALLELLTGAAEPIAITAGACRLPGGSDDLDRLWTTLRDGRDCVREVPADRWSAEQFYDRDPAAPGKMATRWGGFLDDVRGFDPAAFRISPREAAWMDPQQRILLEVAYEAFEAAGVGRSLAGSRTGVYVGVSAVEYSLLPVALTDIDAYLSTGVSKAIVANRLSYQFGLHGPSIAVDTACSSSLVAIHLAMTALRRRECDQALAAGVQVLVSPILPISFTKWGMMAPDGRCKTFDAAADGFVRGEGCGALVLRRLSDALAEGEPVLAVLRGSALNQDGRTAGLTAPNPEAQVDVLRRALADAGVRPEEVGYVETHGTGTALGDPIEVEALAEVLGGAPGPIQLGAIKTNFGHLESAAGIAGVLKALVALRHGEIPPNLHFSRPNPNLGIERTPFQVPTAPVAWPEDRRVVGISSFGFGGTNAHVVMAAPPGARPASSEPAASGAEGSVARARPLLLSAHSPEALAALAGRYVEHVETATTGDWASHCWTAAHGRFIQSHRSAVVAADGPEAVAALRALAEGGRHPSLVPPVVARLRRPRLAFVLGGQGGVWAGMGRAWVDADPDFGDAVRDARAAILAAGGPDVLERLDDAAALERTELAQPCIFALQLGLAAWLARRGVKPSGVVGHSVGELTAAHLAGALDLDGAARAVVERARLMAGHHDGGRMLEVERPAATMTSRAAALGLDVAVVNRPSACVVAGPAEAVARLREGLEAEGVRCLPLDVRYAFHARALAAERPALEARLAGLVTQAPRLPLYSTVTGARLTSAPSVDHLGANLAEPVRFADAIAAMGADGYDVFVELGPHALLSRSVEETLAAREPRPAAVPTMLRGRDPERTARLALGRLFAEGVELELEPELGGRPAAYRPPPAYPWQRVPCWGPVVSTDHRTLDRPGLVGERLRAPGLERPVYVLRSALPAIQEHRIGGAVIYPIAGLLEALQDIGRRELGGPIEIHGLSLRAPLEVGPDEEPLRVVVQRDGEGLGFEIQRPEATPHGETWAVAASARGLPAAPASTDVDWSPPTRPADVEADAFYLAAESAGAALGPRYRSVKRAWVDEDGVTAEFAAPPEAQAELGHFALHPGVLDAALQAYAASGVEAGETGTVALPHELERAELGPLPPHGWVRTQYRQRGERTLIADVSVMDPQGAVVVRLSGVHYGLRSAARGQGLARALAQHRYAVEWVPAPPVGAEPPGSWAVVGPEAEAVAEALREAGVVAAVRAPGPGDRGVLDTGPLALRYEDEAAPEALVSALTDQLLGLVERLRALDASGRSLELVLLTRRAAPIGDAPVDPLAAALAALAPTLEAELPSLRPRVLDLDQLGPELALGLARHEERAVAVRGEQVRVARLVRAPQSSRPAELAGPVLVTGGAGAVGLAVARALGGTGAGPVALASRRIEPAGAAVRALAESGVEVRPVSLDVRDTAATAALLDALAPATIVHAAGVLADAPLLHLDRTRIESALGPKLGGAQAVHRHRPEARLLLVSSVATQLGSPGQAAYALANGFLEGLAERRRAQGRAGLAIAYGPWLGDGMAGRLGAAATSRAAALGVTGLAPDVAAEALLQPGGGGLAVLIPIDWTRHPARGPFYERLVARRRPVALDEAWLAGFREAPPRARQARALERVRTEVARVLGLAGPASVGPETGLFDLGVDSMTALELTERLEATVGVRLPATFVFERPTVRAVAEHLDAALAPSTSAAAPEAGPSAGEDALEAASEDELLDLLEAELAGE